MDASVKWHDGLHLTAVAGSGHEIELDADPSVGGHDKGARPLELMAMSLIGCTAMDVLSILKKMRQEVTDFEVTFHADRAEDHPKVYTAVQIMYLVTGKDLDPNMVERAIELSAERYCPAHAMLGQAVSIESNYEIIEAE